MTFVQQFGREFVRQLSPFLSFIASIFRAKVPLLGQSVEGGAKVISILPYLAQRKGDAIESADPVVVIDLERRRAELKQLHRPRRAPAH